MCMLFVYVNPDPKPGEYKIILASNRDEQYTRPSKPAHQWTSHEGVYGGNIEIVCITAYCTASYV